MAKRKKIMVIDDDDRILLTTKELLEMEGYDVVTFRYGFGATSAIRANQPDLVLMDINMPALSGENLSRLIRSNSHTRSVPIVFFSSNDEDSLRRSVDRYGVQGYICKGDIVELREKVHRYVQRYVSAR